MTADYTDSDAARIAAALGGAVRSGRGYLARCPAHQDRTPSLSLTDSGDGRLLWRCFAGCSQEAVRDELIARGLHDPRRQRPVRRPGVRTTPAPSPYRRADMVRRPWHQAVDPRGTLAQRYLNRRELALDDDLAGRVLRFHPACPWEGGTVPALVAAFHPITEANDDADPVAILRIGLNRDGSKIGKKMLGPVGGACIKLDRDDAVTMALGVAEGLETAMRVRAKGWRPVWCCGSAGAECAFPVLAGIEALTIFADNDANGVGLAAARQCAQAWLHAGAEVFIRTPNSVGADWQDVAS